MGPCPRVARKAAFQFGPVLVAVILLVLGQHFLNGGPYRASLPGTVPLGTSGIVSWLALVAAGNALWNAVRSGRQFMYYDLSFVPSLVVLFGAVQSMADRVSDFGYYFIQFVGVVFAVFLVGVFTKNIPGIKTLNMDGKMHFAAFWMVHGSGVLIAAYNIVS